MDDLDIEIQPKIPHSNSHCLAILASGGPAPGINGVISAAAIEAINHGWKVIGILDGFKCISEGGKVPVVPLTIDTVSRVHQRGGSILRTFRENPKEPKIIHNIVESLLKLGVDRLITIGGDSTAFSASLIEKEARGRIYAVHVPKTIDNDLPLPGNASTFGFQTARDVGTELVENIMEDAYTTNRWYFVVTMGRQAGHLAIGIGKAAGATLTIIAEEFKQKPIKLSQISDILEGAIIKRLANGKEHGVAVLAEGLTEKLDPADLARLDDIKKDEHDKIRLSEVDLGKFLKDDVKKRLSARGIQIMIVDKSIGYELRCAPPIPFDAEYTRDLGYGAAKLLREDVTGAMVTLQAGRIIPVYFQDMLDPVTGRTKVRYVDINTESYEVARSYMIRLEARDFENPEQVNKLAKAGRMTTDEFINKFGWIRTT